MCDPPSALTPFPARPRKMCAVCCCAKSVHAAGAGLWFCSIAHTSRPTGGYPPLGTTSALTPPISQPVVCVPAVARHRHARRCARQAPCVDRQQGVKGARGAVQCSAVPPPIASSHSKSSIRFCHNAIHSHQVLCAALDRGRACAQAITDEPSLRLTGARSRFISIR